MNESMNKHAAREQSFPVRLLINSNWLRPHSQAPAEPPNPWTSTLRQKHNYEQIPTHTRVKNKKESKSNLQERAGKQANAKQDGGTRTCGRESNRLASASTWLVRGQLIPRRPQAREGGSRRLEWKLGAVPHALPANVYQFISEEKITF